MDTLKNINCDNIEFAINVTNFKNGLQFNSLWVGYRNYNNEVKTTLITDFPSFLQGRIMKSLKIKYMLLIDGVTYLFDSVKSVGEFLDKKNIGYKNMAFTATKELHCDFKDYLKGYRIITLY